MFYFVSTPIGNLKDITLRAIEVLKNSDVIFCEDTRHSRKLLEHYDIKTKLDSFHQFSEKNKLERIKKLLKEGKIVSYISDAGTPIISDPGYEIVKFLKQEGIEYDVIPGATALIPALMLSGFPPDRFFFGGFLGKKENEIEKQLKSIEIIDASVIFYQSPLRILKTLKIAEKINLNREVAVIKELTKIHQKAVRGKISEVIKEFSENEKGEFVIVFSPPIKKEATEIPEELKKEFELLIKEKIEPKKAIKFLSKKYGINSKKLYSSLTG
ncbi:16S rRNA (cytidine1402-2'-O)-methyltransferase [Thermotomaculum hydrothermale]|uniref:Ribosomal RNA small subunit methyltransferase I n=1 Tax=Thermotomaculum hydrothermale TaxID=981385 RepID=A0A7R6PYR3_9BACT|nr:16S rRNA (cytidine(1402)-2'-O)-methyltransferase [Thermotomaculum hydrothermale]BBB33320.1 16S rRNA (cytidine1402-2'-O)-methyltransferase [Thermotomaculum hydrothermale]